MLFGFFTILGGFAATNHDQLQASVVVFMVEASEFWSDLIAGAAVWIGEDQQHTFPTALLERNCSSIDIGKVEVRSRRARFETVALDPAFTQGLIARAPFTIGPRRQDLPNEL